MVSTWSAEARQKSRSARMKSAVLEKSSVPASMSHLCPFSRIISPSRHRLSTYPRRVPAHSLDIPIRHRFKVSLFKPSLKALATPFTGAGRVCSVVHRISQSPFLIHEPDILLCFE
jgi:hypothetical protein